MMGKDNYFLSSTLDTSEKCRICFSSKSLMPMNIIKNSNISYADMLHIFSKLSISNEHCIPNHLCEKCSIELERCYSFKKKCEEADLTWQRILNNVENKLEKTVCDKGDLISIPSEKTETDKIEMVTISNCNEQQNNESPCAKQKQNVKTTTNKSKKTCKFCLETFDTFMQLYEHKRIKNHLSSSKIQCSTCLKSITGKSYSRHMLMHNDEYNKPKNETEQCPICSKKFNYRGNLNRHMKRHKDSHPFKCNLCEKTYTRNEQLKLHLKTHSIQKPPNLKNDTPQSLNCSFCNETFGTIGQLVIHHNLCHANETDKPICEIYRTMQDFGKLHEHETKGQTNDRRTEKYTCNKCNRSIIGYHKFRRHKLKHEENKFPCNYCNTKFGTKEILLVHIRRHTGERPFVCNHCDRAFTTQLSLRLHMSVHRGISGATDKAYICESCGKIFPTKPLLQRHAHIHEGIKQYVCHICKKAFRQQQHLKQHTRVHTGEKPYMCSICGKSFSTNGSLKQHLRIHTKESPKHICPICNKGCHERSTLRKHVKIHGVSHDAMGKDPTV